MSGLAEWKEWPNHGTDMVVFCSTENDGLTLALQLINRFKPKLKERMFISDPAGKLAPHSTLPVEHVESTIGQRRSQWRNSDDLHWFNAEYLAEATWKNAGDEQWKEEKRAEYLTLQQRIWIDAGCNRPSEPLFSLTTRILLTNLQHRRLFRGEPFSNARHCWIDPSWWSGRCPSKQQQFMKDACRDLTDADIDFALEQEQDAVVSIEEQLRILPRRSSQLTLSYSRGRLWLVLDRTAHSLFRFEQF